MQASLCIVVPCYNEAVVLPLFYTEINKVIGSLSELDTQILFIDDGSKDGTMALLEEYAAKDNKIKYISFSRNFGKEAAIYAGLRNSKADYVVIMDADLQDPPALLPEMLRSVQKEGYDSVATRRVTRKGEPPIRSFFAHHFYKLMNKISKTEIVDGARDYRLMNRKFVNALLELKEYNRFSKGIFGWVGFKTKWITFENVERAQGTSKWNFLGLARYAFDGFISFSALPVTLTAIFTVFFAVAGVATLLVQILLPEIYAAAKLYLFIACIMCFALAFIFLVLWFIGQYIFRIYNETRKRPIYIAKETEKDR